MLLHTHQSSLRTTEKKTLECRKKHEVERSQNASVSVDVDFSNLGEPDILNDRRGRNMFVYK